VKFNLQTAPWELLGAFDSAGALILSTSSLTQFAAPEIGKTMKNSVAPDLGGTILTIWCTVQWSTPGLDRNSWSMGNKNYICDFKSNYETYPHLEPLGCTIQSSKKSARRAA
jgi:hypothetical protein